MNNWKKEIEEKEAKYKNWAKEILQKINSGKKVKLEPNEIPIFITFAGEDILDPQWWAENATDWEFN